MPQSIIVYRNPLEQAFWEGLMGSPVIIPVFGSLCVGVLVLIMLYHLAEKRCGWRGPGSFGTGCIWLAAAASVVITFNFLNV